MRGLFWVIALFGLAAAVALGVHLNDGYALFVWPPYRVELSLSLLAIVLILAFFAGYWLLRSVSLFMGVPRRVREFNKRRQHERASRVFQDAVRLLFEGRFGQAMKKATEAHASGTAPGLSALIAARAAQRMREPEKQQYWMTHAMQDDPKTEAATLMLEAEMMLEARRFDEALSSIERLHASQGRHIPALRLELKARQGAEDWDGVLKLSRQLAKRNALVPEVVREVRTQAHLANLDQRADDSEELVAYMRSIPKDDRGNRVSLAAAKALVAVGADLEAQKLIDNVLDHSTSETWSPALVSIYGRLGSGDQLSRIAKAESWLKQHPEDAKILIALGRMCFRKQLWGKAQSYLEASLSIQATQEAHLELAKLFDQLEQVEKANKHYRASVQLDTH